MSATGDPDLLIRSRSALLDALEALRDHRESVVLIGAQAIYLHTGELRVALPAMTKDSDLAIDSRTLASEPLIEEAMRSAGFLPHAERPQPGTWISLSGVPVDLMVPEAPLRAITLIDGALVTILDVRRVEVRQLLLGDVS